jgi:hypothetical protein
MGRWFRGVDIECSAEEGNEGRNGVAMRADSDAAL